VTDFAGEFGSFLRCDHTRAHESQRKYSTTESALESGSNRPGFSHVGQER